MSLRFFTNIAIAVAGGAVVVASQAFRPSVAGWSMFGVSIGVLALLGVAQLDRDRGHDQHLLDVGTGALVLWSAVASVVYTGTTLTWLSFGEALALVGFGLAGLIANELTTERVIHSFEALPAESSDARRAQERIAA
jgi:hypothetical protein